MPGPKWSQNFLVDKDIARKCIDLLRLGTEDHVLEIGPGRGALTDLLLERAGHLVAVEIDPELQERLCRRYGGRSNFRLVRGDFLDLDLGSDPAFQGGPFKVIGNLPYAVVSPILQKVAAWNGWTESAFMVQKEVAERLAASPGTKAYRVLTLSLRFRCRAQVAFEVPARSFRPVPRVESAVVRFERLEHPLVAPEEEVAFFRVVKGGFMYRRKTLVNSLMRSLELPADRVRDAVRACGIPEKARAETLSLEDFKNLASKI